MNEPTTTTILPRRRKAFSMTVSSAWMVLLSRLNQGRHAALEGLANAEVSAQWRRWVPAGGVAASRAGERVGAATAGGRTTFPAEDQR